ncbi:Fic family protein [Variovorax sp. KK3]|uniref:Fic family protein n=1 Tax=Variovorax sp. KK3 TaxID=1855728 RepID=UPI00097C0D80|nr:Fic family protein [Variovorax sp. KK3]
MTTGFIPSRLESADIFRDVELAELRRCAEANPLAALLGNARWKEESAINFAYTSAQIEGNTYSRADTITLLKLGRTAGGKSFMEAQMIVNLRDAYSLVLDHAQDIVEAGIDGLRRVHAVLMRGILPDDQLGATRKTTRVRIAGTEYVPPDGVAYIEKQADAIFGNVGLASNAFDASVYAACNLSYLQVFEDGNKRTSRVFQNAILIAAGLPPIQFPISMIEAYIDAQLVYYETGDYLMHRGFVLETYRASYPDTPPLEGAETSS